MPDETSFELLIHEWAAIALVLGFIGMLAVSAYISSPAMSHEAGPPHYLIDQTIEVFVLGEVESPGGHRVLKGSTVESVLEKARPLVNADLSRLKKLSKVRANQTIRIPAKRQAAKKPKITTPTR